MSQSYSAKKDHHPQQLRVNHQTYFDNPNEPRKHISTSMEDELEAELQEYSGSMRQEFRRLARRMRNRSI